MEGNRNQLLCSKVIKMNTKLKGQVFTDAKMIHMPGEIIDHSATSHGFIDVSDYVNIGFTRGDRDDIVGFFYWFLYMILIVFIVSVSVT